MALPPSFGEESRFGFDELFFSRTNLKGIIQSGNSVFQRVSKYDWDEMLLKPHSLIRHPGMPRGVFHLFWDTILSNQDVGAYVVNQAKDGSYYWVFAIASPTDDGFLSVRLKPGSSIFQTVQKKYAELLEIERSRKISPAESHALLLDEIQKLGFHDYSHFMTEALRQEIEHRQSQMNQEPVPIISQLREILEMDENLQKKCDDIFAAYGLNALVPLNLEIQAARIGREAASIGVISSQYESIAQGIQEDITKFMEAGERVREKVSGCQFDVCHSLLQDEMLSFFKKETKETPIDKDKEISLLQESKKKVLLKARTSLASVEEEFGRFKAAHESIRKKSAALEIIAITGKIEIAKVKRDSSELQGLLEDLNKFKTTLRDCLKSIDEIGDQLIDRVYRIKMKVEQNSRLAI